MPGPADVRLYHEQTVHSPYPRDHAHLLAGFRPLDPANRPDPFKRYPGIEPVALPRDLGETEPALRVLSGVARPEPRPLDAAEVARLLFLTAGVTRVSGRGGWRSYFRTAQSAGNLHPVEVYLACGELPGLPAGLYHYDPLAHALRRLRAGDVRPHLAAAAAEPGLGTLPAALVLTGIPWRTCWKYRERGLRHVYWDAGSMLANLLTAAEGAGVRVRVLLGFVDELVGHVLGVDGEAEFPVAVAGLGEGQGGATAPPSELPPVGAEVAPISRRPVVFPLVALARRAFQLGAPGEVLAWRRAAPAARWGAAAEPPPGEAQPVERVILRRGSTRLMRPQVAAGALLGWGMAAAVREVPGDAPPVLEHGVAVHAVEGLAPGLYRWADGRLEPVAQAEERRVRAASRHLCLDQPLGGDSAYTHFAFADLGRVLEELGPRGYAVAQLQAGLVSERLGLAATALGYGATGLTFYDDEVARAFRTGAACMLATAVGVPAYRPTAGGGPGRPAELRHFDRLMARLEARMRAAWSC